MGFWFFLSVVVTGRFLYKAYKIRAVTAQHHPNNERFKQLERELSLLRQRSEHDEKRLIQLEEAVYFGDFELKRQFNKLEQEMSDQRPATR